MSLTAKWCSVMLGVLDLEEAVSSCQKEKRDSDRTLANAAFVRARRTYILRSDVRPAA